ncbi:MAG: 6-phosphogluconolactonase [Patulibacter sp.]|nr:6-phosphogluconolactonase [Patulibacter sp.]
MTSSFSPTLIAVADADAAADAVVRLVLEALPPADARGGAPESRSAPAVDDALDGPPGTVEGVPGTVAGVGGTGPSDSVGADPRTAVALTGGRSPIEAFRRLGAQPVDWSCVDVFLADERCVPYEHEDSNARVIDAALGRRGYTLHRLSETGTPGDRARAYAHQLGDRPLALVLLGLGEDGHVASLFPRHGGLDANGATVGILDSPKPPPERVSLTLSRIADAARIVLLVTGSAKAEGLRRTLADGPSPDAPASLLPAERLTIVADADALRAARDAGLVSAED